MHNMHAKALTIAKISIVPRKICIVLKTVAKIYLYVIIKQQKEGS